MPHCDGCPALAAGLACPAVEGPYRRPGDSTAKHPHPAYCVHRATDPRWDRLIVAQAEADRDGPPANPPLPSLARQAVNFTRAQVRHTLDGRTKLPPEAAAARVAVCEACDQFRPEDRRCAAAGCGCFVDAKASWRSERCPLGRWPEPAHAD